MSPIRSDILSATMFVCLAISFVDWTGAALAHASTPTPRVTTGEPDARQVDTTATLSQETNEIPVSATSPAEDFPIGDESELSTLGLCILSGMALGLAGRTSRSSTSRPDPAADAAAIGRAIRSGRAPKVDPTIAKHFGFLFLAALSLETSSAKAYVYPPILLPQNPNTASQIFVSVRTGECDGIVEGAPGYPQITQSGNAIKIVLESTHDELPILCNLPDYTSLVPVGHFQAGSYTIQVDRHYEVFLGPEAVEHLGQIAFEVANTEVVPALNTTGLGLLLAGISAMACIPLKRRLPSSPRLLFSLCIAAACSQSANASISFNGLVPAAPVSGRPVAVNLSEGTCDAIIEAAGYPQITRNGFEIRLLLETFHADDPEFCNYPNGTGNIPIGTFEPGRYTLRIDRHYVPFPGPDVVENVGTTVFDVSAPTSVPTLSVAFFVLLIALVILVARFAPLRYKGLALAGIIAILPATSKSQASNKYVAILLSSTQGAPTADQVVDYFQLSPPQTPPPLQAFATVSPNGVDYLIPMRASGAFLAYLDANPDSARTKLERYLLISYSPNNDMQLALSSLESDEYVIAANLIEQEVFSAPYVKRLFSDGISIVEYSQYGRDMLNIDAGWALAGGYSLVGDLDSGLATAHPALRQFAPNGQFAGGPYIPASSLDIGDWPNGFDLSPDEADPIPLPPASPCNPQGLVAVEPTFAGHGTHVAGLIAGNPANGVDVKGTCKHCGIAMWKVMQSTCQGATGLIVSGVNTNAVAAAATMTADSGIQILNMSLGGQKSQLDYCAAKPNYPTCLAIAYAAGRDLVMVAASGNARTHLQFPASDSRVISVGGFDGNLALWDESPGNSALCPVGYGDSQCGSNYTTGPNEPRQELMASASSVLSTTYPGKDWNPDLKCGDSFGPGGGIGLCTGTSMSSPQVAGIVGILRSINPLVLAGKPVLAFGDLPGIRTVLAQTTFEAQSGQGWTPTFGYGRPDAAAAAARMLGKVEGRTVKNRVTPLFRSHSATTKDYADTTTPQMAIAFAINQVGAYQPEGALVPGYPAFPTEPNTTPLPVPRANVYVLITEYKPRPEWPDLVPLYMIDRTRNFPVGCTTGTPGCNSDNRDFTLVATTLDIEKAHSDGYNLRTIQGYVYVPCTPEPACIPPGAQKFYRACRNADDDCATFLESERTAFEAAGYVAAYPNGKKLLGYAYPSVDTDNDGLIDGFEYVIGTRADAVDSDGDGASDGVEFPMAGVAVGDPCDGPLAGSCPADGIFADGFQHG